MGVGMCILVQILKRPEEGRRYLKLELQITVSQLTWALATKLRSCAGAVDALEATSLATTAKGFFFSIF